MSAAPVPGSEDALADAFCRQSRRWCFRIGTSWYVRENAAWVSVGDGRIVHGIRLVARSLAASLPVADRATFCGSKSIKGALVLLKADPAMEQSAAEHVELQLQDARRRTLLGPIQRSISQHFTPLPASVIAAVEAETGLPVTADASDFSVN